MKTFLKILTLFLPVISCWPYLYKENCMNWTVIILEAVVLTLAFTAMILIPLVKNPVWWIHDYPKDIQEKYFETHERIPSQPVSAPALIIAIQIISKTQSTT